MHLLTFLLYTAIFMVAGLCILSTFYAMQAEGGALDVVFGWQKMLNRLYNGNKAQQLLGKALGDCQQCTSFWFMFLWFFAYWGFCRLVLGWYITDVAGWWLWKGIIGFIWYSVFHSIGAVSGLFSLLKRKRNVSLR